MTTHLLPKVTVVRRWVTHSKPIIVFISFCQKYWFNIIAMIRDTGFLTTATWLAPYYLDEEA